MGGTLIICSMWINLFNTFTIVEKNFDDFFFCLSIVDDLMRIINRGERVINVYRLELIKNQLILIVLFLFFS